MTITYKARTPLVVPPSVRKRAGIKAGDKLEFAASGGVITITAKPEPEDDDYTPEQRKYIEARLAEALRSETIGPFETAAEMIASMKDELKKRRAAKRKSQRR